MYCHWHLSNFTCFYNWVSWYKNMACSCWGEAFSWVFVYWSCFSVNCLLSTLLQGDYGPVFREKLLIILRVCSKGSLLANVVTELLMACCTQYIKLDHSTSWVNNVNLKKCFKYNNIKKNKYRKKNCQWRAHFSDCLKFKCKHLKGEKCNSWLLCPVN